VSAPATQEFEKSSPLPPRTLPTRRPSQPAPAPHTSNPQALPTRARPALFLSQTRTCLKTTKNCVCDNY